jgi:hypothetical protein
MSDQAIHTALRARLNDFSTNLDPIAYENTPFTPEIGVLWLRENFLPAETDALTLSGGNTRAHRGIYQITVFAPMEQAVSEAEAKAEALMVHFARGTSVGSGRVTNVYRGPAVAEDGWFAIPISVQYLAPYDG